MTWDIFAALLTMFGSFTALIFWIMSRMEDRLHLDISNLCQRIDGTNNRLDETISRMDANFLVVNSRIDQMSTRIDQEQVRIDQMRDQMSTRIDQTQALIMHLIETSRSGNSK